MFKRITSTHMLAMALATLVLLPTQNAMSAPPLDLHGIDLSMVLSIQDHARMTHIKQVFEKSWDRQSKLKRFKHIKTIVIDPGHGGENQGALGVGHVHEKFLTMDLAYALRDKLQRRYPHARIILTRYWDQSLTLSQRIHMANKVKADLFLSLHYNSATTQKAVGVETFFLATKQVTPNVKQTQGKPIASARLTSTGMKSKVKTKVKPIQGTQIDALANLKRDMQRVQQHQNSGLLARTVQSSLLKHIKTRNRGVKQANFGVLRGANMPAVVVEAGFLSHPKEGQKAINLKHRTKVVNALMDAIVKFDGLMAKKYARPTKTENTKPKKASQPVLPPK